MEIIATGCVFDVEDPLLAIAPWIEHNILSTRVKLNTLEEQWPLVTDLDGDTYRLTQETHWTTPCGRGLLC